MADIFTTKDADALLKNKVIVFIGDSNIRAMYKDLLWLLNQNTLIHHNCLRRKLEKSFMGDNLDKSSQLSKSRDFFEERSFKGLFHYLKFYFVTRCYCDIIVNYIDDIKKGSCPAPDVIVMNSCLWDLTRWGPNGVEEYKLNMVKLMELLKNSLPKKTLFIWTTALPISLKSIRGGLIIKQIEFMERSLRFHIMEANVFTRNLVNCYSFDVVDLHYHLQFEIARRSYDGVHYLPIPVRLQTNLYLTHIALSWGRVLPQKGDSLLVQDEMVLASGSNNEKLKSEFLNYIWNSNGFTFRELIFPQPGKNYFCSKGHQGPSSVWNGIKQISANVHSAEPLKSENKSSGASGLSFENRSFLLNCQERVHRVDCDNSTYSILIPSPELWQPALSIADQSYLNLRPYRDSRNTGRSRRKASKRSRRISGALKQKKSEPKRRLYNPVVQGSPIPPSGRKPRRSFRRSKRRRQRRAKTN